MKYFLIVTLSVITQASIAQNYWQQEVNYTIKVKLNDKTHELFAEEEIIYTNNSPNELSFIYFHLWPNAYKNNKTALGKQLKENGELNFYRAKQNDRGYIDQLDFKVNGIGVKWEYDQEHIDVCKIILPTTLKSGEKITISTPFHVKIPKGEYSRLGHIEQQYQITQWYPKPAVYDANGWNQMPYLDQGEFYSEYGSFDVYITLPKNYVVGATGDLIDCDDEVKWLDKLAEETKYKDFSKMKTVVNEKGKSKTVKVYDNTFPESSTELKTLHFKQSNVHDFAFFCDKRYNVLKGEIELPHSKRKVSTWVMFTNQYADKWLKSISYMNDAIYYYSKWNGDYPYAHATAVDGALSAGGGMEYPNVTVIGEVGSDFTLETVIMHEVGHNWFYGILGSNERIHPWMDEGINSANELRYIETKYPNQKLLGDFGNSKTAKKFDLQHYFHKSQYELLYWYSARKNADQPIELPSQLYTTVNYGGIVYSKTAICFDYLKAYLGEDVYDKCMQAYFDKWKFKHPQPKDLREIFEKETGKNLSWFFDDLISTSKKLDYKIKNYNTKTGEVTLVNTGSIVAPVAIAYYTANSEKPQWFWVEGFSGVKSVSLNANEFKTICIDPFNEMPEINRNNNTLKHNGLFKKIEPLKLQFGGSLDNPKKSQLYWVPAMGWNKYNGYMLGLALYNNLIPEKKLEFSFAPMFGFGDKNICGYGVVTYSLHPNLLFETIRIGAGAARFAYSDFPFSYKLNFNKVSPQIELVTKKIKARSLFENKILIRSVYTNKDSYYYSIAKVNHAGETHSGYAPITKNLLLNELTYTLSYKDKLTPASVALKFEHTDLFMKVGMQSNLKYNYKKKNKNSSIRLFAGKLIKSGTTSVSNYRLNMSGYSGLNDYLFDYVFLGRSESTGVLSQQFAETDGAFKSNFSNGKTSDWLAAVNIKTSLPFIPFIRLFADIGICANDGNLSQSYVYNAGAYISFKGLVDVYFPILISKEIKNYNDSNKLSYLETIRFTFNLHQYNPVNFIRNISF